MLIAKLGLYVRAYSDAVAPTLSLRREAVITACALVRRNSKEFESFAKLLRELRRWSDIAHPLQLFESHMDREEQQARDLFMEVRDVCLWLANDQQAYEAARIVTQYCAEIFKELPRALSQMQEEIATLSMLSKQKAAATLLEPLCKVLGEVQQNHRQIEKELLKSGFGLQSNGLTKRLYDDFAKAVIATAGTEIADLPWSLVRDAAISLNNNSRSPRAAAALINGLVSHFSIHRPSDDIVIALKNDQQAAKKNILQGEFDTSLKQENWAAAATVAEKLIEIEKDFNEVAALKQMRDAIAAKRQSNKRKAWGWGVAALIFLSLIAIGNQSSSKSSSPPSASPSPSPSPWSGSPPADSVPKGPIKLEERPRVGSDVSFTQANIRYCTFQRVRLESARSSVASETDELAFNALVDDWNSRCARYRYTTSDKNAVDAEVSSRRWALEAEGRALANNWPSHRR